MIITSFHNETIRHLLRLRDKKAREESSEILIDGKKPLSAALDAGVTLRCIFYTKALQEKDASFFEKIRVFPCQEISPAVYEKISYGNWNDGILALAAAPNRGLQDLTSDPNALFVLLEKVEKPGNIGAILRTCDAVASAGVLVCDSPTDLYNPNIIRSSLGTCFSVPYLKAAHEEVRQFIRERKIHCVALSPDAKKKYSRIQYPRPLLLIAGSEHDGLSSSWLQEEFVETVSIPMKGVADSLNVSVALTVVLYEACRSE